MEDQEKWACYCCVRVIFQCGRPLNKVLKRSGPGRRCTESRFDLQDDLPVVISLGACVKRS